MQVSSLLHFVRPRFLTLSGRQASKSLWDKGLGIQGFLTAIYLIFHLELEFPKHQPFLALPRAGGQSYREILVPGSP